MPDVNVDNVVLEPEPNDPVPSEPTPGDSLNPEPEPEPSPNPAPDPEPEPEPEPKGVQKRINELVREREDVKRENERLLGIIESMHKPAEPPKPDNKQPEPTEDAEPTEDQFEDYPSYIKAITAWQVKKSKAEIIAEVRSDQTRKQQEDEAAAQKRTVDQQVDDARAKYPDWDKKTQGVQATQMVADTVWGGAAENPAELSYFLATNPAELDALNKETSPARILKRIGILEDRIANAKPPEQPKKTVNPSPTVMKPVVGAGTPPVDLTKMDTATYIATRRQQEIDKAKR